MRISLFGNSGLPAFNWAQGDNYVPIDIDLFREKAIYSRRAITRVLKYFDVSDEDCRQLFSSDNYEKEYDGFILKKETAEKKKIITIYFTKTI